MKSPSKVETCSNAGRSSSPTKSSKGKERDRADMKDSERLSCSRKPGSQLKAGWKLQPISLPPGALCSSYSQASAIYTVESPSKKRAKPPSSMSAKKAKKVKKLRSAISHHITNHKGRETVAKPIEILSDSDDDVLEISGMPVASMSAAKCSTRAMVSLQISVDPPSQETNTELDQPLDAEGEPCGIPTMDDLDFDLDLEEDEIFLKPISPFDGPILNEDNDLVDDDQWGDSERTNMGRSDSMDGGEYDDSLLGYDEDEASQSYEGAKGAGSDDDILEVSACSSYRVKPADTTLQLMEREDGAPPHTDMQRRISDTSMSEKGLLRPLSSLIRRSISPSANISKVTLDTRPNAFTTLMQGNGTDKQWAEAEESEKAAVSVD